MKANYKERLNMRYPMLVLTLPLFRGSYTKRKQKALKNMQGAANWQWGLVNGWYDERNDDYRNGIMDVEELYKTIYREGITHVYDDGFFAFNKSAESYMKDIRFCGKDYLQRLAFWFTVDLIEEAMPEIEATDEECEMVYERILSLKSRLGIESMLEHLEGKEEKFMIEYIVSELDEIHRSGR